MLIRIGYIIVIVFAITMDSCYYSDPCYYSGLDTTNVEYTTNFISNSGKEPVDFTGDSLNSAAFGIRLKMKFASDVDPNDLCSDYNYYLFKNLNIISLKRFNSTHNASSNINGIIKVLNSTSKYPVPLDDAIFTNDNFLLFDEMPDSTSIQQFQIIATRYNAIVLNVTLEPIKLLR